MILIVIIIKTSYSVSLFDDILESSLTMEIPMNMESSIEKEVFLSGCCLIMEFLRCLLTQKRIMDCWFENWDAKQKCFFEISFSVSKSECESEKHTLVGTRCSWNAPWGIMVKKAVFKVIDLQSNLSQQPPVNNDQAESQPIKISCDLLSE